MTNKSLGIDAGGTYIKYGVVDNNNKIVERNQVPTPTNKEDFLAALINIMNEYNDIDVVGISLPGIITRDGFCKTAGAHSHLEGFHLGKYLTETTGKKIAILNDVNAIATCEQAVINCNDFITIALGTGIGGAIVQDGQLLIGKNGMAGEFGFAIVNNNELDRLKTWSWKSSTVLGFVKPYNEFMGTELDGIEVFNRYYDGEEAAIRFVNEFAEKVAIGLFNLTMSFDPEKIIIGGSISSNETLIALLNEALAKVFAVFPELDPIEIPKIEASHSTSDSGLIGASIYVRSR